MGLNIKNQEAYQLARDLAQLTGESMTRAVTVALRERLERLRRVHRQKTMARDLLAIGKRCAKHLKEDPAEDHAAFLYDEQGLPK